MKWSCPQARENLQAGLDGQLGRRAARSLRNHLQNCGACEAEQAQLRRLRQTLGALGAMNAPEDLGLRLRVAISQEAARRQNPLSSRLRLRWSNTGREWAMRWSAGLATSLAMLGTLAVLVGVVASPSAVQASDQPIGVATAAHFRYASFPLARLTTVRDEAIVVQAFVGEDGRVYDYRVVAGDLPEDARAQLENTLYFSVFAPATVFGQPVRSQVTLSFSGIAAQV